MVIRLPSASAELRTLDALTPREIVAELDRYVVGQAAAKRAVAVALRNRLRRQRLSPEAAAEVTPRNLLLIGPTGVGKTELARRLAQLSNSPFVKVEASRFTEVGYVGRDVESIVRDLAAAAVELVRREQEEAVRERAERAAEERLLDLLLPPSPPPAPMPPDPAASARSQDPARATRERLRAELRAGALDPRTVEVEVQERGAGQLAFLGGEGMEQMELQLKDALPGLFGGRTRRRSATVAEARQILARQEQERLVDPDEVTRLALQRAESSGIVFLDEIDKIAGREGGRGPEVSREGVQRDLLPIVEGTTVQTKWGPLRTDHVLFVAAGAFHVSKPADLIPELQGRFPIRVELEPLGLEELRRILTEPRGALLEQYRQLLGADGLALSWSPEAVAEIARCAMEVNAQTENIGARRLTTLLEALLEEAAFGAPEQGGPLHLDGELVRLKLQPLVRDRDLSRFIL